MSGGEITVVQKTLRGKTDGESTLRGRDWRGKYQAEKILGEKIGVKSTGHLKNSPPIHHHLLSNA